MNTDDRRVRKTKRVLRDGLAELMLEKELRNITVRELSDKVDIHRATFYAHYTDIYDLYDQLENAVFSEIGAIMEGDLSHSYEGIINTLVDYFYDNSQICRMFLDRNGNRSFHTRLCDFLEEKYIDIRKYETGQAEISEGWRYLSRYHIQGGLSIVSRWAENGFAYPKDKITKMVSMLDDRFADVMPEYKE